MHTTKRTSLFWLLFIFFVFLQNNNLKAQCVGGSQTGGVITNCSGSGTVNRDVSYGNYVLVNVVKGIQYKIQNRGTGNVTIRTADGSTTLYHGATDTVFTATYSGQIRVYNCYNYTFWGFAYSSTIRINIEGGSNTADNPTRAGTNQWVEHFYAGMNFEQYLGYWNRTEPNENFDEDFGDDADGSCFGVYSEGNKRMERRRRKFSARFLMNSTKRGLYRVDLGSDDGSRLFVDNVKVYDWWSAHSFDRKSNQLINLTGNSQLKYEYFENTGSNRVIFQNFTRLIENTITGAQSICVGNDTPTQITGDNFTTLPSGYTKVGGTGFQWVYSTTSGGTTTDITGATGQNFTPNLSNPPFNTAGTYYIYRKATLSHNNFGVTNPYTASNISNEVIVTINAKTLPAFTQVAPVCSGSNFTLPTTSTNGITGAWSPAINNTATTEYTFTPNVGECATTTTMTVTVNSLPTIIGNPNICADSESQGYLYGTGTPAATNPWSSSRPEFATIDDNGLVTGVGAGTTIITYTDENGCTAIKSLTVATCTDTDGDGVPDFRDLDNDNDGILDIHECKPKRFIWSGAAPTSGQKGQTITGVSGSTTVTITDNSTLTSPRKVTQVYIYGGDSGLTTSGVLLKHADENGNYAYLHPADRGATYTFNFNAPTTEKLYFYMTALDVKKVEFTNGVIVKAKGGAGVGTNTFINTTPTSGADSRGLTVEIPAGTQTFSYTTTTPGDGYMVSLSSGCTDYDNDGTPNYLDPDSDGDGCQDAIEGGGNVTVSNVDASGQITNNAGNVVVDVNGIPIGVTSGNRQTVGDSQKAVQITLTTQPTNTSVCINSDATFSAVIKSIEATQFNTGVPDYTNNIIDATFYYIWQVDKNDGNGFINMTGTGVSGTASNGATVTLNLGTQANADKNGYKYRLSLASSEGNCTTESNEATLTVNPLPNNIGTGFSAGNICEGEQGTLTFNGINTGSYPYTIKYINNANSSTIHEQNITDASAQTFNAPDLNTSSSAGTYDYTLLSITDANGCTLSEATSVSSSSSAFGKKTARIIIRENPANVVAMSVNSNTACTGGTAPVVTFTNSDTKPIIVTYTVNGGTAQTIEVPKRVGATNGSATVNVATTTAGAYTYNATKVRYKSSPNCEANINLSQCIVVFPNNNTAPTVNSGTGTPISVTSPTAVTGFTVEYSFDDGATWGTNTPPTADNCAGYKIRTRYVLANACGTTSAGSTVSCAISPATTRVVDTTAPTFDVPTTAISECVNNITEANYNNTTNGDVNNPPDYYEFTANDTSLDISNLQDNCCTDVPTISWSISPASNGVTISGTGQPSQSIGGKKLWLNISATNPKASYVQKTYTITYNVTDCNGNTATKTRNIIITPRPKINRVE